MGAGNVDTRSSLSLLLGLFSEFQRVFEAPGVRSPRTRVLMDRGEQDYATLQRPIITWPFREKKRLSHLPMPSLWNSSPFLMVEELPTLENIERQNEKPSTRFKPV